VGAGNLASVWHGVPRNFISLIVARIKAGLSPAASLSQTIIGHS
jgi:hypothetical protein